MPPCLNQDILFDIGKKLIEEGDADAVIQFGLSGREPLKALCKVFATVTNLKLYDDGYSIGWDEPSCSFHFTKTHARSLMSCIGGTVTKLRMDYCRESSVKYYQLLLDTITEKQKLISLSIPTCYDYIQTWTFIQSFSSTLKHLEIDSFLMGDLIRDCLDLKTLTVIDINGTYLFQHCPRASTIIFKSSTRLHGSCGPLSTPESFCHEYCNFFVKQKSLFPSSPYLDTIKELIFDDIEGSVSKFFHLPCIRSYMKTFPSLEHIQFNINTKVKEIFLPLIISSDFKEWKKTIKRLKSVPGKISFVVRNNNPKIDSCKFIFEDFEFDDATVPDAFCFQQMVQSAGTKSTLLEIQFFKPN